MSLSSRLVSASFVAVFLVAATGAGLVLAHGGATGIVKERMDLMKGIGEAMKRLNAMFQGKTDYDAEAVRESARTIHSRAGDHITQLFPEDSLHKPSEALATIWEEWSTFERYANDLQTYSAVLEAAAGNEFEPMQGGGMSPGRHMMGQGAMMGGPGSGPMMGGQGRGTGHPMNDPEALKQMPPMASFMRLSRTCNACHSRFRVKK